MEQDDKGCPDMTIGSVGFLNLTHACWGLMTLMEQGQAKPELNDLYFHSYREDLS